MYLDEKRLGETNELSAFLERAIKAIEELGWTQGSKGVVVIDWFTKEPCSQVCLLGALNVAEFGQKGGNLSYGSSWGIGPLGKRALNAMGFFWEDSAYLFNDTADRTREEVIARIRGAIS